MKKVWLPDDCFSVMLNNIKKYKVKCSHCGNLKFIYRTEEKSICKHCGYYVFRNKRDEFKYRMLNKLK